MRTRERGDETLLILFCSLIVFPLLFALRALDDNTLTNWRWIFARTSPVRVFLLLAPATGLALLLSRVQLPERRASAVLFILACSAVLPLWSEPELIIDASRYFLQAAHLEREGVAAFVRDWGRGLAAWTDLPLVPFLYGLLFRLFGEHRIVVQSFTTLLFALTAVLTAAIGRRLWDRETGFLAGVLLLAMPYLLTQVPLMLVDVPTMFLVTLSIATYLDALDRGGRARTLLAAGAAAGAVLVKYSAWPMLLVLPLITALSAVRGNSFAVRRSVMVIALAAAFAGTVLLPRYRLVLDQLALLRSYQLPALGRWKEGILSTVLFQVQVFVPLLACFGAWRAVRSRDRSFFVPAWFVLFLLVTRAERIRYLLPLFPLLALMAAYGLRTLFAHGESRRFAAYSALAASIVLVLAAYRPFLEQTTMANLRDAGAYLDTLPGDTVRVQVLPQRASSGNTEMALPVLDLFTRKRLVYERRPLHRPDEQVISRSPLRFTWEQRLPVSYEGPAGAVPTPRVVIADEALPDAVRSFAADTGTFRYRTAVSVLP